MFQYSRLDVMFNRIRINEYTSVNDLESLLGITDRTIRNDIQEINNDLEKNGAIIKLREITVNIFLFWMKTSTTTS